MAITIHSPGWRVQSATRGRRAEPGPALDSLPPQFLADDARIAQEAVLERTASRGAAVADEGGDRVDLSFDIAPDRSAYLAVRHPSGALTFHLPVQETTSRGGGRPVVRFQVVSRARATRGPIVSGLLKAILVEVRRIGADRLTSLIVPKLAMALEKALWDRAGRKEGWHSVTRETLATGTLTAGVPSSPLRTLLFLHGTFSHAAAAYKGLATSTFFDRMAATYGDRVFAFNHFSVSRTPEDNARMLLEALPEQTTTFDVVTHSRGGLVLRNLVERREALGAPAQRFQLHRAVLVAAPNAGTPLATPRRWEETFGWFANLMELFPANPFTTGAEFIANGLVWIANHASGDLPGLHAMDGDGALIAELQQAPGPDTSAYSALVSNFHPSGDVLLRLADAGLDQFFGSANDLVVPTEGGWHIDDPVGRFIPASRIGCFGAGGNISGTTPNHVDFFDHAATVDFLVNALSDTRHAMPGVDPRTALPNRRLLRSGMDRPATTPVAAPVAALIATPGATPTAPPSESLRVIVTHGDLTFEPEALLIGHYASTELSGSEAVIDRLIGGVMRQSLEMGLYPRECGANQIFMNRRIDPNHGYRIPRPRAVIVAGLGQEGSLGAADLVRTVKQAVIAWAHRLSERREAPAHFDLSSTLMASGGVGISAGEAARLIAQGVADANDLLAGSEDTTHWPRVGSLKLVELYLDRATDAWRTLHIQQAATPGRFVIDEIIHAGVGGIQRPPDSGYRGAAYDFISVESRAGADGDEISFALDTRRARSELRGKKTQSALLGDLVRDASDDRNADTLIGRSLFNLLVPMEIEAYLAGKSELQLQLSPTVAGIPWELLDANDDRAANEPPWAIRTKLIRKLKLEGVRENVRDADASESALVIGEPECPKEKYSRLFGAHEEAVAVRTCLTGDTGLGPERVTSLISESAQEVGFGARAIISALYERPWRILHVAGHGAMPDEATGSKGGVVLSNDTFLGPDEVASMRIVPELVFFNCCHLGRGDDRALLNPRYNRAQFASGVAQELIRIGVKVVVAAGWAVDDDAASAFARTFYGAILNGARFIDAVGRARADAYDIAPHSNTWAAYQCYGDPDWRFRRNISDPNRASDAAGEFDGVASETQIDLALRRMTIETRHQGRDAASQVTRIKQLEDVFETKWLKPRLSTMFGTIADRFGEAFVEAGDVARGIDWYRRALAAEDGGASLRSAEQLSNALARHAWESVRAASAHRGPTSVNAPGGKTTTAAARTARRVRADAEAKLAAATRGAAKLLDEAAHLIRKVRALDDTMERASLAGAIEKRRALIGEFTGNRAATQKALTAMLAEYTTAERLGRSHLSSDLYYPEFNRLLAEVALKTGRSGWQTPDRAVVANVKAILAGKDQDADFFSLAGQIELDQLLAVADGSFVAKAADLRKDFEALHIAVPSHRRWGSVYDTALLLLRRYRQHLKTAKQRQEVDTTLALLHGYAHSP